MEPIACCILRETQTTEVLHAAIIKSEYPIFPAGRSIGFSDFDRNQNQGCIIVAAFQSEEAMHLWKCAGIFPDIVNSGTKSCYGIAPDVILCVNSARIEVTKTFNSRTLMYLAGGHEISFHLMSLCQVGSIVIDTVRLCSPPMRSRCRWNEWSDAVTGFDKGLAIDEKALEETPQSLTSTNEKSIKGGIVTFAKRSIFKNEAVGDFRVVLKSNGSIAQVTDGCMWPSTGGEMGKQFGTCTRSYRVGHPRYQWYSGGITNTKRDGDVLRHGFGRVVFSNGDIYEGMFYHGQPHGRGVFINQSRSSVFYAEFEAGRRHGVGCSLKGHPLSANVSISYTDTELSETKLEFSVKNISWLTENKDLILREAAKFFVFTQARKTKERELKSLRDIIHRTSEAVAGQGLREIVNYAETEIKVIQEEDTKEFKDQFHCVMQMVMSLPSHARPNLGTAFETLEVIYKGEIEVIRRDEKAKRAEFAAWFAQLSKERDSSMDNQEAVSNTAALDTRRGNTVTLDSERNTMQISHVCPPLDFVDATDEELEGVVSLVFITDVSFLSTDEQMFGVTITSDFSVVSNKFQSIGIWVAWAKIEDSEFVTFTGEDVFFDWFGFPQFSRFGHKPYVNLSSSDVGIDVDETHIFNDSYWSGRVHLTFDLVPRIVNVTLCSNSTAVTVDDCGPIWDTWQFYCRYEYSTWGSPKNRDRVFALADQTTPNELTFSRPTSNIRSIFTNDLETLWSESTITFPNVEMIRLVAGEGAGNVMYGCMTHFSNIGAKASRDVLGAAREPMYLEFSSAHQNQIGGLVWSNPIGKPKLSTIEYTSSGGGVSGVLTIDELQSRFLEMHDYEFADSIDFSRVLHALNIPNSGFAVTTDTDMVAMMQADSGYGIYYWRFAQSFETSLSSYAYAFPYSKHFWTVSSIDTFRPVQLVPAAHGLMSRVNTEIVAGAFSDEDLCGGGFDLLSNPDNLDVATEPTRDHLTGFFTFRHPEVSTDTRLLNFDACVWDDETGEVTHVCSLQFDVSRSAHVADVRTDSSSVTELQSALSGFFKLQVNSTVTYIGTYVDTHDNATYEEAQPVWIKFKGRTPGTNTVPADGIAFPSILDFEDAEGYDWVVDIYFCEYPNECTGNSSVAVQHENDMIQWFAPTVNGDIDFTGNLDDQVPGKTTVYSSLHSYRSRADSRVGALDTVLDTDVGFEPVTHDVFVAVRSPAQPDLSVTREWGGQIDEITGIPASFGSIFAPMPTLSPLFFCYDFLLPFGPTTNYSKFNPSSNARLRGQWVTPEGGLIKVGSITIDPITRAFELSLDSTASCVMSELNAEPVTKVTGTFPRRMSSPTGKLVGTWGAESAPTTTEWQRSGVVAYEMLESFSDSLILSDDDVHHSSYMRITFTSLMDKGTKILSAAASTNFIVGLRVQTAEEAARRRKTPNVILVVAFGLVAVGAVGLTIFYKSTEQSRKRHQRDRRSL